MANRSFASTRVIGKKYSVVLILIVLLLAGLLANFGLTLPMTDPSGKEIRLHSIHEMRYGIDIRGGVEAIFAPRDFTGKVSQEALNAAVQVFNFRLDQLQILDREVSASTSAGRIIVRFPWRSDESSFNPEDALKELGQMALLTFRSPDGQTVLDGSQVANAAPMIDSRTNSFFVSLTLDPEGKEAFKEATSKYLGKQIGIYLDETMISSPVVNDTISDGQAMITGNFTQQEAIDLASKINGGSLPFAMEAISASTISPSLGQNALHVMTLAGVIGFAVICVLMILRYRLPGIVGCFSLTAQVIGILLAIAIPQQTLTLQGIAGIILSIGMGVDANIIIAERIKEEANKGSSLQTFLYNGFTRAFSSVMDGNVTVAIAAIVLMIFGSGSFLSFGYSLLVGVILNGITGVYMSRTMIASLSAYDPLQKPAYYGKNRQPKPLKVFSFNGRRKIFIAISVIAIVGCLAASLIQGIHLSIAFKGGSIVSYDYQGELDLNAVEDTVATALPMPVTLTLSQGLTEASTRLQVSVAGNQALTPQELDSLTTALQSAYPEANFQHSSSQLVSPTIGREMLRNGLLALVVASVLIVAYVWFSFRSMSGPSAGVMALVALLHDIILAALIFIMIGSEINETIIAVVLTILGFSINDTIVVYDRIRELIPLNPDKSLSETVDMAVSASLTRTISTSVCIFIAVVIALVFAMIYDLESIIEFAVPILVGTVSGTFSSLCLSGPLWTWWKEHQKAA